MYPALAAAEALVKHQPQIDLDFVGSGGLERDLVQKSGVPFSSYIDVRGGPIAGVSLGRKLLSAVQLVIGTGQAFVLMLRRRPGSLFLTGGWSSLPAALAAWALRVPTMIFLPDIEPGSSIRLLQRFARRVAVTVAESSAYFPPGKTVVTGYPLRQDVQNARREDAIDHFQLDPRRQTLLVFGGSRGSRSINRALLDILPDLLDDGRQIIHVTGTLDWAEVDRRKNALAAQLGDSINRYHAFAYLHHDMGLALAAADLVLSRAGASVLAEFPLFGLPSILVPYPYAWRYQKVNADWLAERGAALVLEDARMGQELLPTLRALLADSARMAHMRTAAAALARPDGAAAIASELVNLAVSGGHP